MLGSRSLLALVGWIVSIAAATDVVYVTDLEIFTVLAPCAQAAVSGVIDFETVSHCPSGASALQSCICSKNSGGNLASISYAISASIDYTCGSTATDDQASASTVLSGYCDQDFITSFPSPSHTVSDYIVDLSAYNNLAKCAQTGLEQVVLGMTWDRCPEDASLLATCACEKNQNSQWASEQISDSVKFYCDDHTADVASAQGVFSGYCGLVDGTTSFPQTSDPPGDVNYYITDLKEYKALAACARTAVSYNVLHQTDTLCPSGPKALASCACLRSEMTGSISSLITSDARYYCDSTAADDISSALDVWDLYCSAAKGLATPLTVTGAATDAASTAQTESRTNGAQKTNTPGSGNGTNADSNATSQTANTGVIAGAVVGSVAGTALIALAAFLLYRRSKKAKQAEASATAVPDAGKPELDSTSVAPAPTGSPSPSIVKNRMEDVSPVSAVSSPYAPPPMPELHNQPPATPELHGREAQRMAHQAYSQQVYEVSGQTGSTVSEAHGQPMSELQGMGWQSGPVAHAYEMDGGDSRPSHN
ncbi:hypothetical protein F5Y09DRAFT_311372 [Xylaria sp. FL1042]|nr:hypothetical protein F5Y09DRAFT_311372 [Xylaria sp. FL1042]